MFRVMCVWVPRFGLALYCREDPHLLLESVVLAESDSESALVCEASGKAVKSGVTEGMTVVQAGMLCDDLIIRVKDREREESVSKEIVTLLQHIVPFLEVDQPGKYYISANGFDKLYGGEEALARQVIQALRNCGLASQIGISDNEFSAQVAARLSKTFGINCVPQNQARYFLEPLPVRHFPIEDEIKEQLVALGLRTIGQVAAFPTNELIERFGTDGALMMHLAQGNDPRHFVPLIPEEETTERMILDYPIFSSVSVGARVQKLLVSVMDRLAMQERGARKLSLSLKFENRTYKKLELGIDRPTLSVRKFLQQLQKQLERLTFPAGVCELALTPINTAPLRVKQIELSSKPTYQTIATKGEVLEFPNLFRSELQESSLPEGSYGFVQEEVTHALSKVATEVAPTKLDASGSRFRGNDGRVPQAPTNLKSENILLPSPLAPLTKKGEGRSLGRHKAGHDSSMKFVQQSMVGLRVYHPVKQIEVASKEGTLRSISINRKRHTIVKQLGPWKISGHWWGKGYSRRYFEIETMDKKMFLIYESCEIERGKWYLQGMFD